MTNLDQQIEELIKERNAFESRVIALEKINQGLVDAVNQSDDDGKHVDLVWLTRDEMKEYSDVNRAGGINAIKADAIEEASNKMLSTIDLGQPTNLIKIGRDFFFDYVNKLRTTND